MKIIKELSEMISDEIQDAKNYADQALKFKAENQNLAETFFKLSQAEMDHMGMLHDQATRIIETYRKEHGEPPAAMMAVYDYLHEKQMDEAAQVKAKQALYKE